MGLNKRGSCSDCSALALCLLVVLSFIFHETGGEIILNPKPAVSRKLLIDGGVQGSPIHEKSRTRTARIGIDTCSKDDVVIYQGATDPLPNGIPTYTVQILNMCSSGCVLSNIHLSCGWFSSARLVNPSVFRRISYDDCLVNNGGPIDPGQSLSFVYANTYQYQLVVSSVVCS